MPLVKAAVASQGLAPDVAMVSFPMAMFLPESDISPLATSIDRFVHGLTCWMPTAQPKPRKLPMIGVEAADPLDLVDRFNREFLGRGWGDGLPLVPPTSERVDWVLRGTDLPAERPIGSLMPRGGIVSVHAAAVALAMAGGRPEYLPIVIAALEAMMDPESMQETWQATSSSTFPAVIVGGSVAKEIRLNSGFGLLGPSPRYPAGASIGRALRLLQQNVGGAVPGTGTIAAFGGMRYTNAVFAEDEEGLPPDWKPFNEEYLGYAPGDNTVALAIVSSASNILRRSRGDESQEQDALAGLYRIASYMRAINTNSFCSHAAGTPGILLLTAPVAQQMAGLGWSKDKIRRFLWDATRIPLRDMEQSGVLPWLRAESPNTELSDPWPITSRADNIAIVVAGGAHPTHAFWMQSAVAARVTKARIQLPARWPELLAEAAKDLAAQP